MEYSSKIGRVKELLSPLCFHKTMSHKGFILIPIQGILYLCVLIKLRVTKDLFSFQHKVFGAFVS